MNKPRRSAVLPTRELTLGDMLAVAGAERFPADVAERLRSLWTIPLGGLAVGDLHFLVERGIAASLLLPLALERLERDPLLAASGRPGDLLETVFTVGRVQVKAREYLRERAWRVLTNAGRDIAKRPECAPLLTLLGEAQRDLA